jgi:hypothetical protein
VSNETKGYHGAGVMCRIHNASTTVTETDKSVPDMFVPECLYCLVENYRKLHKEYTKVKEQRDILVEAIGVVKTVQELK